MTIRSHSFRVSSVTWPNLPMEPGNDGESPPVSFNAIFESEFDYVWKSLYRLGVQARDLEDVTHDVFVDVYRRFSAYDSSRHIRPWLFAFAFRAASDYRRRGRNRFEVIGATERPDDAPLADEQLASKQALAHVAAALETIDLDRRAVFIAHDLEDCPVPEIAAALGIPVNTAYSRLRLAREQFAKAIIRQRARQGEK
jgi:RNA polymerase sigma-70 factor, ECF subfamily